MRISVALVLYRARPSSSPRLSGSGPCLADAIAWRSREGASAVWEMPSYRDFLHEDTGDRHVVGSAVVIMAAAVLLLIVLA